MKLFIPNINNINNLENYNGFCYRCEQKNNELIIHPTSKTKYILSDEVKSEGLFIDKKEIKTIDNIYMPTYKYINNGILYMGNINFMKSKYNNKNIHFNHEQVISEIDFIENICEPKRALDFINNNLDYIYEQLNDKFETYENYIFEHLYLNGFIYNTYLHLNESENLKNIITCELQILNQNANTNIEVANIDDLLYLIRKNNIESYNDFKNLIFQFLY